MIGGILLGSFSLNLINSLIQMTHIMHGVEILQMDRFARQKIYKRIKYANEDVIVTNNTIKGYKPIKWGVKIQNKKVGILLSDNQIQSLSGQVFRGESFGYRVRLLKGRKSIEKDENNCISYSWSMEKNLNPYKHIVNTAVYPYYYEFKTMNKLNNEDKNI